MCMSCSINSFDFQKLEKLHLRNFSHAKSSKATEHQDMVCYMCVMASWIMGNLTVNMFRLTIKKRTKPLWRSGDQRKHQSSTSLAFVRGINRSPVNSLHKKPVTRKMFPFDDIIMVSDRCLIGVYSRVFAVYIMTGNCWMLWKSCIVWAVRGWLWYITMATSIILPTMPLAKADHMSCDLCKGNMEIHGLILGLRPANERRRYKVTQSFIGWAQT